MLATGQRGGPRCAVSGSPLRTGRYGGRQTRVPGHSAPARLPDPGARTAPGARLARCRLGADRARCRQRRRSRRPHRARHRHATRCQPAAVRPAERAHLRHRVCRAHMDRARAPPAQAIRPAARAPALCGNAADDHRRAGPAAAAARAPFPAQCADAFDAAGALSQARALFAGACHAWPAHRQRAACAAGLCRHLHRRPARVCGRHACRGGRPPAR